jgi:hypothetical protein
LLQNEELAARLRSAGRLLYEKTFHREAAWKQLDAAEILKLGD